MKKTYLHTLLVGLLALAAPSAFAQVTLVDSDYFTHSDDLSAAAQWTIGATDLNSGVAIDLTGASKLVVTVGSEGDGNGVNDDTITSLTYGGVAMTEAVQRKASDDYHTASVWYLDLDGVSLSGTDFVIDFTESVADFGFAVYSLAGTVDGVNSTADSSAAAASTLTINTTTDDEFVVTTMVRNNFDDDGESGIGVIAPLTEVFYEDLVGASTAAAYRTTGAAGDYDLVINDSNNGTASFVAAGFGSTVPTVSDITLVDVDYSTVDIVGEVGVTSSTIAATDLNSGVAIDLTGASKLVVSVGGEGGGNGANDNTITSLTYGGVAMTEAVQRSAGISDYRTASIWYLDLDGVSLTGTDFVLTYETDQVDFGFAVYSLAGTVDGVYATADSSDPGGDDTLTIITPTADEFVVTTMTRNTYDASDGGVNPPLTEVFYGNFDEASAAAAYRTAPTAGAYDLVIGNSDNSSTAFVAASFGSTPPPVSDVTLVDTLVDTSETDGTSFTIDASGLDTTGASKLVVTVGAEGNSFNGADPGSMAPVTYGGVDMTLIDSGDNFRSSVWYLDLAGASLSGTDIELTFNGAETVRGYYLSAYTLANTADGVSSSGVSGVGTGSATLTQVSPPTAGEYLIAGYSRNSDAQNAVPVTAWLNLLDPGNVSLNAQYTNASIYGVLADAGTQLINIDGMNSSGATVIATFAAAVSGTAYEGWAGGAVFTEDDNGDGVDNGLAWILGAADASVSAVDKLPTVSNPTGYLQLDFTRENPYAPAKLYVEYGSDLTGWTKLLIRDDTGTISGSDVEVVVSAGDPDSVQVKIPDSHAAGGKLFARLSAEE